MRTSNVTVRRWQTRCASPSGPDCRRHVVLLVLWSQCSFRPAVFWDKIPVSHRCNRRVSPKEWMLTRISLWAFVGGNRGIATGGPLNQANSRRFMRGLDCDFPVTRWHTVCSLRLATLLKKIGFPGWPDPNLDWVSGFGGSVLTKRGLAPAPFFIVGPRSLRCLVRCSREWFLS